MLITFAPSSWEIHVKVQIFRERATIIHNESENLFIVLILTVPMGEEAEAMQVRRFRIGAKDIEKYEVEKAFDWIV